MKFGQGGRLAALVTVMLGIGLVGGGAQHGR